MRLGGSWLLHHLDSILRANRDSANEKVPAMFAGTEIELAFVRETDPMVPSDGGGPLGSLAEP